MKKVNLIPHYKNRNQEVDQNNIKIVIRNHLRKIIEEDIHDQDHHHQIDINIEDIEIVEVEVQESIIERIRRRIEREMSLRKSKITVRIILIRFLKGVINHQTLILLILFLELMNLILMTIK
jgi:hypothetical protein